MLTHVTSRGWCAQLLIAVCGGRLLLLASRGLLAIIELSVINVLSLDSPSDRAHVFDRIDVVQSIVTSFQLKNNKTNYPLSD